MIDRWLLAGLLGATFVLFLRGPLRPDLVAILALLAAAIFGLVPVDRAFEGFGHPAVVTVAAILVVSRALGASGAVEWATRPLERLKGHPVALLTGLTVSVTALSSVVNNVGALSLLMPIALRLSRSSGRGPSFFLMPLAFGSLLGGMTTLIGTPPNLIVADARAAATGASFGLFDFAPVGLPVAVAGVAFLVLWGWRLVPRRDARVGTEELIKVGPYLTEATVSEGSPAAGKELGQIPAVDVQVLSIARKGDSLLAPSPHRTLRAGDLLVLMGESDAIQAFAQAQRLELVGTSPEHAARLIESDNVGLLEAVVLPGADIVGKSATNLRLRNRYGINLLGIAREGARVGRRLGTTPFRAGDVLLVQGARQETLAALASFGCLPLAEREIGLGAPARRRTAVLLFATAIGVVALGLLPPAVAFLACAAAMVVAGVLPIQQAYAAIDWPVVVLLGAMIPLGIAIETSGLADLIAQGTVALGAVAPAWVVLTLVLVATMFLSDVVNNAAAAVMMCPIALAAAHGLGANGDPFLLAVGIGASCAFLTPIGHQSNLLVMGPGGYRFGDYWRLGLALEAVIVAVAVPALLLFWPLYGVR